MTHNHRKEEVGRGDIFSMAPAFMMAFLKTITQSMVAIRKGKRFPFPSREQVRGTISMFNMVGGGRDQIISRWSKMCVRFKGQLLKKCMIVLQKAAAACFKRLYWVTF